VRDVGGRHGAVFTYYARTVPGQKRRYGRGRGDVRQSGGGRVHRAAAAVHTMGAIPSRRISIRRCCMRGEADPDTMYQVVSEPRRLNTGGRRHAVRDPATVERLLIRRDYILPSFMT